MAGVDKSISPTPSPCSLCVLEGVSSCRPFVSGFVQSRWVAAARPRLGWTPSPLLLLRAETAGESEDRTGT